MKTCDFSPPNMGLLPPMGSTYRTSMFFVTENSRETIRGHTTWAPWALAISMSSRVMNEVIAKEGGHGHLHGLRSSENGVKLRTFLVGYVRSINPGINVASIFKD